MCELDELGFGDRIRRRVVQRRERQLHGLACLVRCALTTTQRLDKFGRSRNVTLARLRNRQQVLELSGSAATGCYRSGDRQSLFVLSQVSEGGLARRSGVAPDSQEVIDRLERQSELHAKEGQGINRVLVCAREHGLVFDPDDMARLIATNRDFMWNKKVAAAAFQRMDGAEPAPRWKDTPGVLWTALTPYDETLRKVFVASHKPGSWGGLALTPWFLSLAHG